MISLAKIEDGKKTNDKKISTCSKDDFGVDGWPRFVTVTLPGLFYYFFLLFTILNDDIHVYFLDHGIPKYLPNRWFMLACVHVGVHFRVSSILKMSISESIGFGLIQPLLRLNKHSEFATEIENVT